MPCPCEQARGTVTCSLRVRSLPGSLEDDALLEAVVLLGSLAGWQEGDRELAGSGLVSMGRQAGRHGALAVVSYTLAPRRGGHQTPPDARVAIIVKTCKITDIARGACTANPPERPCTKFRNFSGCASWDLNAGDNIT